MNSKKSDALGPDLVVQAYAIDRVCGTCRPATWIKPQSNSNLLILLPPRCSFTMVKKLIFEDIEDTANPLILTTRLLLLESHFLTEIIFTNMDLFQTRHGWAIASIRKCGVRLFIHSLTSMVAPWRWGTNKLLHPTLNWKCDYLSMLGLKLNHISKNGAKKIRYSTFALCLGLFWFKIHQFVIWYFFEELAPLHQSDVTWYFTEIERGISSWLNILPCQKYQ